MGTPKEIVENRIAQLEQRLKIEVDKKFDIEELTSVSARVSDNLKIIYAFAISELESILLIL